MATCLECGSQHARVKASRVIPKNEKLSQVRVVWCPHCGPRSQAIEDTGPAPKSSIPQDRSRQNSTDSHR